MNCLIVVTGAICISELHSAAASLSHVSHHCFRRGDRPYISRNSMASKEGRMASRFLGLLASLGKCFLGPMACPVREYTLHLTHFIPNSPSEISDHDIPGIYYITFGNAKMGTQSPYVNQVSGRKKQFNYCSVG